MENSHRKIKIITGEGKQVTSNDLVKLILRNLSWRQKLNPKVTNDMVAGSISSRKIHYQPFWIAKVLVFASRHPFPPKTAPYVVFVDAVSGYRGLMSHVPHIQEIMPLEDAIIIEPVIDQPEDALRYVFDVQYKQINRLYLLKKPEQKVKEIGLYHLPFWRVSVRNDYYSKDFMFNANTGENESYLMSIWDKGELVKL